MQVVKVPKDVHVTMTLRETDLVELLRGEPAQLDGQHRLRRPSKTDVLARYSAGDGTLTFTGVLHQRYPIHFTLKPGSRSYGNFIQFLLSELQSLSKEEFC